MNAAKNISRSSPGFAAGASSAAGQQEEKFRGVYDRAFFARHTQDTVRSAQIIVPILLELIRPESVIDIGCGLGAWLKVFAQHGAKRLRGLDGDYIDLSTFLVDPACFSTVDLSQPLEISESYDLAICLEVAEHLSESRAADLVKLLTSVSSHVLFSAAIPGQRGPGHVNEQWPSYWKRLFHQRGFQRLDPIRRHIWRNRNVQWWYRQNIFLYISEKVVGQSAMLQAEQRLAELDVIYIEFLNRYRTLRGVLGELPRVFADAIRRRISSKPLY